MTLEGLFESIAAIVIRSLRIDSRPLFSLAPDPLMEKLPVLTAISAATCGAKSLPSAI